MSEKNPSYIVYDGECPFCSNYAAYAVLRSRIANLELKNARDSDDPIVADLWRRGFDLNEGMVFDDGHTIYYGSDAVKRISALISKNSSFLNGLIASSGVARSIYPLLRAGRFLALRVRGVGPLLGKSPTTKRKQDQVEL